MEKVKYPKNIRVVNPNPNLKIQERYVTENNLAYAKSQGWVVADKDKTAKDYMPVDPKDQEIAKLRAMLEEKEAKEAAEKEETKSSKTSKK